MEIDAASSGSRISRRNLVAAKPLLTDEEAKAVMTVLDNGRSRQAAGQAGNWPVPPNKKDGDAFLAANKTKEGVVTLPSGLQYKILKEGNGPKPRHR